VAIVGAVLGGLREVRRTLMPRSTYRVAYRFSIPYARKNFYNSIIIK
jgi:hypothetical protein